MLSDVPLTKKHRFILASESPQRKEILLRLGIDFKAVPAGIDEVAFVKGLNSPSSVVKKLSLEKAKAVSEHFLGNWVIGSDTVVVSSRGKILGKPKNKIEAEKMLKGYSHSYCDVYSGLALVMSEDKKGKIILNKKFVQYDKTRIHFLPIKPAQIKAYLKEKDWKYCAGALRIEDAGNFIKSLKGDYWNVVGLPVRRLKEAIFNWQ